MNQKSLKMLNQLLFIVPKRIAILFFAVVQVIYRLGIFHKVGIFVGNLGCRLVRQITGVGRISSIEDKAENRTGDFSIVFRESLVDGCLALLELKIDLTCGRIRRFDAAFFIVPGGGWNVDAGRSFEIPVKVVLEVDGRLALLVDACLDAELSRRNEWFYFSHMNTKLGYYYRRKIASVFASVFAFTFVSPPDPQCP